MDDFQANVAAILGSPRIRGKLVILCEGDRLPLADGRVALSPQMYRRLEKTPDANFYKACVPRDWHGSGLPQFFPCGGRADVIATYAALIERHEGSYLSPDKLYALVDLDIQSGRLPAAYAWSTTEQVHAALYADGLVRPDLDADHRIWVTALVHKEAFFVLPFSASCWQDGVVPHLDGAPLELRELHIRAARSLATDGDVAPRLRDIVARLERFACFTALDGSCPANIGDSWIAAAASATGDAYESMTRALLAIAKIKPLWKQIVPDPRVDLPAETFRDQLTLRIARAIADLPPGAHPLAGFFAWLKPRR